MRKSSIFLAIVFVASTFSVHAQSKSDTYSVGTNVVSLGVGLGSSLGSFGGGWSSTPALSAQYERGLWQAGPGVISLGGYVGYKGYKFNFNDGTNEKVNYTIVGARGAWHWTESGVDNLDLYGGAMLSYNHVSVSYPDGYNYSGGYSSALGLTLFVGGRYFFTEQLAAFAELGYGISYLNVGLALKF